MELLEGIFTRRSIRKYTDEPVDEKDIDNMLKAAMLAPSACNQQPWHFIVIKSEEMRKKVSETSPYIHMAVHAPLVIVICGNTQEEKASGFWVQDCSAATENLLLAARALNLGSVWCGVYPVEERVKFLQQQLGLPEYVIPLNIICIGHTEMKFREENRFNQNCIHQEKW